MQFIYILPGWESSTHDMSVLKDALTRRNGIKVPHGNKFNLFLACKSILLGECFFFLYNIILFF